MKRKNILIIFIILLIIAFFVYIYVNKLLFFNVYKNCNLVPDDVFSEIYQNFSMPSMANKDIDELPDISESIDKSKILDYSINVSYMNIRADEIDIFKVNDIRYTKMLKTILKARAENVSLVFKDYIDEQYKIAKNYKIMVYNDIVILVIYDDANEILKFVEKLALK